MYKSVSFLDSTMNSICSSRPRPLHRTLVTPPQARQWGSNWGKSKGSTKPIQQQPTQRTADQSSPATFTLQGACAKLAQTIKSEFLASGMPSQGGVCIPACAAFMDAIDTLEVAADVKLEMCYLHLQPAGAVDTVYARHMVVKVGGQTYDIGSEISSATLAAQNLDSKILAVVYSLPDGATSLGWGADPDAPDGAPTGEVSKEIEAFILLQLRSASGREGFFRGTPPEMQQARKQVLAFARSLKGTVSNP